MIPVYSIKEKFEIPLKSVRADQYWSPHYNIPIFPVKSKKRVVTIPLCAMVNLILRYFSIRILHSFNVFKKHVLIIGAGSTGFALYKAIKSEPYLGYIVVGFPDDDRKKKK